MCRKPHNTPNPDLFSPQCFTRVYPEEKGKAGERSHCVSQRRKRCVMIPVRIWPLAQTREREIWRSRCLLPSSDVSGPGELKTPDQSVCFKSFSNTNSTQHLTQLWVTHKINKLLPVTGLRENKARQTWIQLSSFSIQMFVCYMGQRLQRLSRRIMSSKSNLPLKYSFFLVFIMRHSKCKVWFSHSHSSCGGNGPWCCLQTTRKIKKKSKMLAKVIFTRAHSANEWKTVNLSNSSTLIVVK